MDVDTDRALSQVQALFHQSSDLSCSELASKFTALIPTHIVFEIALKVLLPILEGTSDEHLPCRIAAAFVLHHLYAPHPLDINPFASSFRDAYASEMDALQRNTGHPQLAWTLWTILQGKSDQIASLSPDLVAQLRPDMAALLNGGEPPTAGSEEGDSRRVMEEDSPANHLHKLARNDLSIISRFQSGRPPARVDLDDASLAEVSKAVSLLLDARMRVLTLSEKKSLVRVLEPVQDVNEHNIAKVQQSVIQCISSHDITALVVKNPPIAHLVITGLLSYPDDRASSSPSSTSEVVSTLRSLPPTTASFEVFGRLLQEVACISYRRLSSQDAMFEEPGPSGESYAQSTMTIAEYVRTEALGAFLLSCIEWIDMASAEEREGFVADDSVSRAIQLLCRFYNSLIKLGVLDPAVEADSAEMASFALRFSAHAEANTLYQNLASSGAY